VTLVVETRLRSIRPELKFQYQRKRERERQRQRERERERKKERKKEKERRTIGGGQKQNISHTSRSLKEIINFRRGVFEEVMAKIFQN
jgi:septal ring factor EnvC (AmiA/AmiB activator)